MIKKTSVRISLIITISSFFLNFGFLHSQNTHNMEIDEKPKENMVCKTIVDSILDITDFEFEFTELCKFRINKEATDRNWDIAQLEYKKSKIDYVYFKEEVVYEWFDSYSEQELLIILNFLKELKMCGKKNNFILVNYSLYLNFEIYIDQLND